MRFFIASIFMIFISACSESVPPAPVLNPALEEINSVFTNFTNANDHIDLIRAFETTSNNFVVELRVDNTMKVSNSSNTQDQNLVLTRQWQALVCTTQANAIAQKYQIIWFSIQQIDQAGELHSVALCG